MINNTIKNAISTERLLIIPATYEIVDSLLNNDNSEIERLGLKPSSNWPRADTYKIFKICLNTIKKCSINGWYDLWMIVKKDDMTIIGDAGFKGEPNKSGEVETGYGLVENERKKGYGTEAVKSLVHWAFSNDKVKKINANCLTNNIGSIRVLEKIGMNETKRDNNLIYWEIIK